MIDDHSRVAYVEIHADETAATAIAVLRRAIAWFANHGVNVEKVLSGNGSAYRSRAWRDPCTARGTQAHAVTQTGATSRRAPVGRRPGTGCPREPRS